MAQIFPSSANTVARASIIGGALLALVAFATTQAVILGPYGTKVHLVKEQPVPFSHEHHVKGLGIDCRYCHTSVEESYYAGMPPSYTCMSCHSQVWNDARMLAPVRESLAQDKPLAWNRVHDLPDFAYFNHSIHVKKGVGCYECHGAIDNMPLAYKAQTMTMQWCLNCHRNPEQFIRPRDKVFDLHWAFDPNAEVPVGSESKKFATRTEMGQALAKEYQVPLANGHDTQLSNCAVCHR